MSDYDTDTVLWSEHQADLLRRLAAGEHVNEHVDWENVAEEIDSVGRSQRIALASHLRVVLEHLMKLEASPATEPRRGWEETVQRARQDIEDLLEDSPSLRPTVGAVVARQLPRMREIVAASLARYGETPRVAVEGLSYDADAVLGGFFPAVPGNRG
ncbi:MAG TPA: DUF29 domain-containing protein [Acetobacteraceae bacterium]|jgi:hypothetical protein